MSSLWNSIDANERAVLACFLTCFVALLVGAAWMSWRSRPHRRVTDDLAVDEYADAAFDRHVAEALRVSEHPIYDAVAIDALRRDLDEWGRVK